MRRRCEATVQTMMPSIDINASSSLVPPFVDNAPGAGPALRPKARRSNLSVR